MLAARPDAVAAAIGSAPAARHLAAVRRAQLHALEHELVAGPVLATAASVVDYYRARLAHRAEEEMRALYLNVANRPVGEALVARGTVDSCTIYPRTVLQRGFECGAAAVILVHNHPSGDPSPSRADGRATRDLALAARICDLTLLDHIIVSRTGHRSLRAEGLF